MIRWRFILLVLALSSILAGVATTIGLAWWFSTNYSHVGLEPVFPPTQEVRDWWGTYAPADFPRELASAYPQPSRARGIEVLRLWGTFEGGGRVRMTPSHRLRMGWPYLALEGALWSRPSQPAEPDALMLRGRTWFPTRPVWPGFVANTAIFSAIAFLLTGGPVGLAYLRRRVKRRCVNCGYPIGDGERCSECGKPLV